MCETNRMHRSKGRKKPTTTATIFYFVRSTMHWYCVRLTAPCVRVLFFSRVVFLVVESTAFVPRIREPQYACRKKIKIKYFLLHLLVTVCVCVCFRGVCKCLSVSVFYSFCLHIFIHIPYILCGLFVVVFIFLYLSSVISNSSNVIVNVNAAQKL